MAKNPKIVWNNAGFEEIRRSPKVVSLIDNLGSRTATQAGKGYVYSGRQGKKGPSPEWNKQRGPGFQGRYRGIVFPDSHRASRDNAKHNTLVKLMGGPGGF